MKSQRREPASRARILDAARAIARRENWGVVTIRKIADELHYTSPIIYQHFENKDDALTAVLREGFQALEAALRAVAEQPAEPTERLLSLADAYWRFAQAQPEVYHIMHGMGGVALDPAETASGAEAVCHIAREAVEVWATANGVRLADATVETELLWSALHGLVCLGLAGRESVSTETLVRRAVTDLLAGWKCLYSEG